jgi:hypothetical protein
MPAIILAAVLAALPAGPPSTPTPSGCVNALVRQTSDDGSVQGRKLADMPPGYLMHAVLREAGGCGLAEVRFAPGEWSNLEIGSAAPAIQPADRTPPIAPAAPAR